MWRSKQPDGQRSEMPSQVRTRRLLLPLYLLLLLWLVTFAATRPFTGGPNGAHLGGDFAIFVAGASVMKAGGNPYDRVRLYRAESAMLSRQHLAVPKYDSFIRVGNPPVLFWLLRPVTGIPFTWVGWTWVLAMYAILAASCWMCLRLLGYARSAAPLAFFLAMPQTVLAAYYGNLDAIVVAALVMGMVLLRRYPLAAGMLLALAWLKPQVALPAVGLILIFYAADRRRVAGGFLAGSALLLLLPTFWIGPRMVQWWIEALVGYSRELGVQPDVASVSGLYVYWAPTHIRVGLGVLILTAAVVLTAYWWRETGGSAMVRMADSAWLWIIWFLATPFAHFHDEVILLLPLTALFIASGRPGWRPREVGILYLLFLSLLLFPTSRFHTDFQSLALVPVAILAIQSALERRSIEGAARKGIKQHPALMKETVVGG